MVELGKHLDPQKTRWDPKERRIRCMEHAVHLAAGHFIKEVAPTSAQVLLRKMHHALKNHTIGDDLDLNQLDEELSRWDDDEQDSDGKEGDDDDGDDIFDAGDTLGKALALVTQVMQQLK
jgi:hypothetical protein